MATYKKIGQDIQFDIPENETFKVAGGETIFRRTSEGLQKINVRDFIPGGYKTGVNINDQLQSAYNQLKGLGIDYTSLPEYNLGDVFTAFGGSEEVNRLPYTTNLSAFQQPTTIGTNIEEQYIPTPGMPTVNPNVNFNYGAESTPTATQQIPDFLKNFNQVMVSAGKPVSDNLSESVRLIEDATKAAGLDSSFEGRTRLWEKLGLDDTMGEYVGSKLQNDTMRGTLARRPDVIAGAPGATTAGTPATNVLSQLQQEQTNLGAVQQQFKDLIPPQPQISAEDILNKVMETPEMELLQKEAQISKDQISQAAEIAKEKVRESAATKGVAFSPKFFEEPQKAIDAETVAKQLGVDIDTAKTVAKAINQEISDQLKEEADKQKTLEKYYEAQGFILNPITGELEVSPKYQKEQEAAQLTQAREERAQSAEARAQARFEESMATTGTSGASLSARVNQEVSKISGGTYGTSGAREIAIRILQAEFPNVDVAKEIYNRVPDNWETMKTTTTQKQTTRTSELLEKYKTNPDSLSTEELIELSKSL